MAYVKWKTALEQDNGASLKARGFTPVEDSSYGDGSYSEFDVLKRTDGVYVVYIEPCARSIGSWRVTHVRLDTFYSQTFDLTQEYVESVEKGASNMVLHEVYLNEGLIINPEEVVNG